MSPPTLQTRLPQRQTAWGCAAYRAALVLLGLSAAAALVAETALAQAVGDEFTDPYSTLRWDWHTRLAPVAQRTFLLLAGFEFAVSAYVWGLRRHDIDDVLAQFFLKFLLLSVLYFVLYAWINWGPLIPGSLAQAGQVASGRPGLSPSGIAELGLELQGRMMAKAFGWGLLVSTADTVAALLAGFLVVVAFALIAMQLVVVLIESYVVIGTGAFFLGFAAFRGTSSLADRYLAYAFSVGVRLFLLYLLVGVGQDVAEGWVASIEAMSVVDYKLAFRLVAGAVIFAGIALVIPNRAARQLTDGLSFGLAEAVRMR